MNGPRCVAGWIVLACVLAWVGAARGQSLDDAVRRLSAEAKSVDQDVAEPRPVFRRPHPALMKLKIDKVGPVIDEMLKPLSGDGDADTYVRWHLLGTILNLEASDLPQQTAKIVKLIQSMPTELSKKRESTGHYDHPDLASQYLRLRSQTRVVEGYPPFEREYFGEQALAHAPPARKAEIQKLLDQMRDLRGKFQFVDNKGAAQRNRRLDQLAWVIRSYRGELIYLLLRTGDPSVPPRVAGEIGRQLGAKNQAALDMVKYVYLAAINGQLARYSPAAMQQMAGAIEGQARGADHYEIYKGMGLGVNGRGVRPRNFADYAFTLVYMLKSRAIYRLGGQP